MKRYINNKIPRTKLQKVRMEWAMITQTAFAKQMDVYPAWISNYETGRANIKNLDKTTIKKMCKILQCESKDIL